VKLTNFPRRMLRSINLTWSDAASGNQAVGREVVVLRVNRPQVAVAKRQADRLGVKVGSTITFAAQDKQIIATVAALTEADGQHALLPRGVRPIRNPCSPACRSSGTAASTSIPQR
jgi:putative ABC transport system permease protein